MAKGTITIADVAKASGVSKSAVSYALNGKAGVSEETRAKVLKLARSMGWKPNSAAKSLSDACTRFIGVVLMVADAEGFGSGLFAMDCLAGLSKAVDPRDYSIVLRMTAGGAAAACRIYEDWIASGKVDAHLILGVELGDPRLALFREHPEAKALFISQREITSGLPTLYSSDDEGARMVVRYLHGLGHRNIARIAGPEEYVHTLARDNATADECSKLGMRCTTLHGKYMAETGERLCNAILDFGHRPTAIICDTDTTAVGALHAALARGISVPEDLSIVAWDDSAACVSSTPTLTALHRDVRALGLKAGEMLLHMIDGETVGDEPEPPYRLVKRASTGPVIVSAPVA
ncbi:LacI family transcriptional regulator [Bifidobacterium rousetti]|uniref:LacI family DNA-binding transcriptional regulator n=1 Tax=Bifidobacterium rousetti TaxID=2045439 RepID=UPI00123C6531|nr:LacI family DNA-binding transcriptional regulator [Bifidobacterium rousetti]KAA8818671.1 LacI family transcriptional regulator [Bifidobacterium rousetti]